MNSQKLRDTLAYIFLPEDTTVSHPDRERDVSWLSITKTLLWSAAAILLGIFTAFYLH